MAEVEVLSRAAAEEKGWVIVHESVSQGHFRAEKPASNGKIEQVGVNEDAMLLAISYYEGFQESLEPPPTPEVLHAKEVGDASRAAAEGEELEPGTETAVLSVTAPDGSLMTEQEWSLRDSGYTPAADAAQEHQESKTDAANEAVQPAEDEIRESETIVIVSDDNQPAEIVSVLPGEETMGDVQERKEEESAQAESDRAEAGEGIGPVATDPEGETVPMGGPPETYDPGPGLSETEQAQMDEHQQAIEDQQAIRDEEAPPPPPEAEVIEQEQAEIAQGEADAAAATDLPPVGPADSADQAAGVTEPPAPNEEGATSEEGATVEVQPDPEPAPPEEATPEDAAPPDATAAAQALADEHGIDLTTVEGTGSDGTITKPDVQAAVDAAEAPPA